MRTLWAHRWLLFQLAWREVKSRYLGSVTGVFWALLNPLALLAIYAVVFTTIFRVRFPELGHHGFLVFAAVVLWPWLALQESAQRATVALQNNAHLIKKVAFPHELLVYGAVGSTYAVHLAGFGAVLAVLGLLGSDLHFTSAPWLVLILLTQLVFSLGLGLALAALQVFLRDVEHVLPPLFMMWFYLTPILYPASLVPPSLRGLLAANPYSPLAEGIRASLLAGGWRPAGSALLVMAGSAAFFWAARALFLRLSPYFEDFL
jgi:lipopolysaccharide transport system permease protein